MTTIAQQREFDAARIERVELDLNLLAAQRTDLMDPKDRGQALVSLQHWTAATLISKAAGVAPVSDAALGDPAIRGLRHKVSYNNVDSVGRDAAHLRVLLDDGTKQEASVAKVDLVHIPYKGVAPAMIALQGGETALMYVPVLTSLPHVKAGRIRVLAVGAAKRTPLLPDLPTVAEAGLPGFEASSWFGLIAPAATSRDIVVRLNATLVKTIGDKDVAQRLLSQGMEPVLNTPEQFAERIRQDLPRWGKAVRAAGIKAE